MRLLLPLALSGCVCLVRPTQLELAVTTVAEDLICVREEELPDSNPAFLDPLSGCIHINAALLAEYSPAVGLGVWSHELGHLLDMRAGKPHSERSADMQAGCSLAKLGMDPSPFLHYLETHNNPGGPYPTTTERQHLVRSGWEMCAPHP